MEDVETFTPLSVTETDSSGDRPRVLSAGDVKVHNVEREINTEDFEILCRYRWANCDYEKAALQIERGKAVSWENFYYSMERNQTRWTRKSEQKIQRIMHFSLPKAVENSGGAKRTKARARDVPDNPSVQALAITESYAVVLVRKNENEQAICWRSLHKIELTTWRLTSVCVSSCQTACIFTNELFLVEDSTLYVFSLDNNDGEDGVVLLAQTDLAEVLEERAHITTVSANKHFIVVAVKDVGFVLYRRKAGLPKLAFARTPISTATLSSSLICTGNNEGVVTMWQIGENEEGVVVEELDDQNLMHDWVTENNFTVRMKPEQVWNLALHGQKLMVSSMNNFIMYERNPQSHQICVLTSQGTLASFAKFGDLIAVVNVKGEIALSEFASGNPFYGTLYAKDMLAEDVQVTVGRQVLAFGPTAVTLLLPDGSLFMIKLK